VLYGAFAAAGAWFLMVYFAAAIRGGLAPSSASWDLLVLRIYVALVLLRMQIVLLYFMLVAGAALIYVAMDRLTRPARCAALACAAAVGAMVLPIGVMRDFRKSGFTIAVSPFNGSITHGDLALVEWADCNLARTPGLLGLGGTAYRVGPEKHLYPFSGAHAVVLFGSRTISCFLRANPRSQFGFDVFLGHVESGFDTRWCLDHGIRWFYIQDELLSISRSLDQAVKDGALEAIQTRGESSIYKVVARP
jgi:hypothetical protein